MGDMGETTHLRHELLAPPHLRVHLQQQPALGLGLPQYRVDLALGDGDRRVGEGDGAGGGEGRVDL